MEYTKEKAISVMTKCAIQYKTELVDKNLLFLCMDKHKNLSYIEVMFDTKNYLHLTGCKLNKNMTSKAFYNKCVDHRLSINDFELAQDGTTEMKLKVLPLLLNKNLSANMLGDYSGNGINLYTEKLIGNVKACVGFVKTKNDIYVPNTVLNVDIRSYVKKPTRVIAVYRKNKKEEKYSEMVYKAKNVDWYKTCYPKKFEYLLKKNDNKTKI